MKKSAIAPHGPEVSPIIAGVWKWGKWGHKLSIDEQDRLIKQSVELGVTTFDHADIYGDHTAEEEFGAVIGRSGSSFRQSIELITKLGIKMPSDRRQYDMKSYDTSREHIIWSVENSLTQLQTDYIDTVLIHRPSPLMDPDEIASAFEALREQGKVRYVGVSNFTPSQFAMLNSRIQLVTNQVQASLIHRDPFLDGTFDQLQTLNVRPTLWSPFGSGKLFSNKPGDTITRIREAATTLAEKYTCQTLDQVYIAWLMRHPSKPIPVLGTARSERIKSAVEASEVKMSREDWFKLWTAATGVDVP